MENLAAQAESSPGLTKAAEAVKLKLAELSEKARAVAADVAQSIASLPVGGGESPIAISNPSLAATMQPRMLRGAMGMSYEQMAANRVALEAAVLNGQLPAWNAPVPLTAGQRMELGNQAYQNYVNGNGPTATINLVVDGQVLAQVIANQQSRGY